MVNKTLSICLLTVLLFLPSLCSDQEDKAQRLSICRLAFAEKQIIPNFESLASYYDQVYDQMNNDFKIPLILMLRNRKEAHTAAGQKITERGEDKETQKAKLLFKLVALGNLIGVFTPSEFEQNDGIEAYYLQAICRSMVVLETAYQMSKDFWRTTLQNNRSTKYITSFAAFVSTVAFEDTLGTNTRAGQTSRFLNLFKQNWPFYKTLFREGSNYVAQVDQWYQSSNANLEEYGFPIYKEILKTMAHMIYERVFFNDVLENERVLFDENLDNLFASVVSESFGNRFPLMVETSDKETSEGIFFDVHDNWYPRPTKIVAAANALAAVFTNIEDHATMFPHIIQLVLIENYMIAINPTQPGRQTIYKGLRDLQNRNIQGLSKKYIIFATYYVLLQYRISTSSIEVIKEIFANDPLEGKMALVYEWICNYENTIEDNVRKPLQLIDYQVLEISGLLASMDKNFRINVEKHLKENYPTFHKTLEFRTAIFGAYTNGLLRRRVVV